uniref:CSON001344 protein n=1 Tax=Culicoides sonorensis TaxID=179676 RepID=A0A336JWP7_CULSO
MSKSQQINSNENDENPSKRTKLNENKKGIKWIKSFAFESSIYQNTSSSQKNSTSKKQKIPRLSCSAPVVDLTKLDDLDDDEEENRSESTISKDAEKFQSDLMKLIAPKSSKDLAIHVKKIQEVKGWLEECDRLKKVRPNSILLLTGPCGSGKLTCLKVLAEELDYEVHEYVEPTKGSYKNKFNKNEDWEEYSTERREENFIKFLRETSRFGTIFKMVKKKKLLVCKDIPNVFLEDPQIFHDVLKDYNHSGRAPLVFITNDAKGKQTNINFKLFNDDTLATCKIAQITFNPVSYMQMSKHLKFVASKMNQKEFGKLYTTPTGEIIDSIIVSSQGDIRNATINLLFACQKGAKKLQTELKTSKLTEKKSAKKYTNVGTDENVTMMHLLGKIFNPKYEKQGDDNYLSNNPETLTDMFCTQANTCLKMIFVNYPERFSNFDDIAGAADFLSSAELLGNEWRDDAFSTYALNIGIRATMVANTNPTKGFRGDIKGFKNVFSSDRFVKKQNQSINCTNSQFICDYHSYEKIIKTDVLYTLTEEMFEDEDQFEIDDVSDEEEL